MIVGSKDDFAIESHVQIYVEATSQMALGYFNVHLDGMRFGVHENEATMLGCSYSEIEDRIANRGMHQFSPKFETLELVEAFVNSYYRENSSDKKYFGMSCKMFVNTLFENKIVWAPDGDEAFDDGSNILQFDFGKKIRIIAFKNTGESVSMKNSIVDKTMDADQYYSILENWAEKFRQEFDSHLQN